MLKLHSCVTMVLAFSQLVTDSCCAMSILHVSSQMHFVNKSNATIPMFVIIMTSSVFYILTARIAFLRRGSRYAHRIAMHRQGTHSERLRSNS